MYVQLRYRYRLYPTPAQQQALARALGCARVVVNDALRARQQARADGLPYVTDAELSRRAITQARATPQRAWLGEVSAVVLQQALADLNTACHTFFHFLSRKRKGSANRKKAVVTLARAHARVAGTRRDWQHKLSTRIIRDSQAVYVEDLCVAGLGRTRLARSVHDAGWSQFVAMLEYKATRYGRSFGRVDRWFPSTRLCSACGRATEKMAPGVRSWTCLCGAVHDRDHNAAKIVLAAGRADNSNACGARVRPAPVPAPREEAGTHPGAARGAEGIVAP